MHLLAWNLIREVMAEAATRSGGEPREVSFSRARRMPHRTTCQAGMFARPV